MADIKTAGVSIDKRIGRMIAFELASMIFTRSQENLVNPIDWGSGRPSKLTDTGALLASGRLIETVDNFTVRYNASYASYVEYGTVPHYVPPRILAEWAQRKIGLSEKEAWSMAYAVSAKIGKEGTIPKHYLRDALDWAMEEFIRRYSGKRIRINLNQKKFSD